MNTQNNLETMPYDYHADTARIGKSGLDLIHNAPIKYYLERIWQGRKPLDTKALRLGKFYHAYLFERHRLDLDFYRLEEREKLAQIGGAKPRGTNAYKEWLAEEIEECGTRVMVSDEYYDIAPEMDTALRSNPIILELLEYQGKCELPIQWEMQNGVKAKSKLDKFIQEFHTNTPELMEFNEYDLVIDYKTCEDASPMGFRKSVLKYRYDVQAAMYIDAVESKLLRKCKFIFIVQEKSFPYLCDVYELSEEDIDNAREIYLQDAQVYKECMSKFEVTQNPLESFYGYSKEKKVNTLFLPNWERR